MDPAPPCKLWQKPGEDKEVVQSAEFPPRLCGHGRTVSGLPEYITAPNPLVDFPPAFTAARRALDYQSSAPTGGVIPR